MELVVYLQPAALSCSTEWYSENRGFYGGALYLSRSILQADRTVFRGNRAALFGGALYAEASEAVFQNSLFRNNSDSLGKEAIASVKSSITGVGST